MKERERSGEGTGGGGGGVRREKGGGGGGGRGARGTEKHLPIRVWAVFLQRPLIVIRRREGQGTTKTARRCRNGDLEDE